MRREDEDDEKVGIDRRDAQGDVDHHQPRRWFEQPTIVDQVQRGRHRYQHRIRPELIHAIAGESIDAEQEHRIKCQAPIEQMPAQLKDQREGQQIDEL